MRFSTFAALGVSAVLVSSAVGCSDTPPPPQEGGYSVEFNQGVQPGMCNLQPHNGAVGTVTSSSADGVVTNGQGDVTIDCDVSGSGTFSVSGTMTGNGNALHVTIPKITTKATMSDPASGSVSYASPNTSGITYSNPSNQSCDFWFDGRQTVAAGKIWVSFVCDEVDDNSQHACGLGTPQGPGIIVLENCNSGAM